jgi:hypothetical protein
MDLKEFTRQTLVQIIEGVAAAKVETREREFDLVNPKANEFSAGRSEGKYLSTENGKPILMVKFDVAITTDRSSEAKAGAGIRIAGIGFGGDMSGSDRDTSVSRVSFEVPLVFPR